MSARNDGIYAAVAVEPDLDPAGSTRSAIGNAEYLTSLLLAYQQMEGDRDLLLERLLTRLLPSLRGFLWQRIRNRGINTAIWEDAVQQSLAAIIVGLDRCRATTDAELMAWVLGVAWRQLAELVRREGPWTDSLDAPGAPSPEGQHFGTSACTHDDLDPGLDVLLTVIGRLNAELPSDAAALLWMRLVADYEWQEVGAQLGITADAARRRFQRLQSSMRTAVWKYLAVLPPRDRSSADAWLSRRLGGALHR